VANVIAASDLGQRFSRLPSRDGLLPLMRGEFELPTKSDPTSLGGFAALVGPGEDQAPLELGEPTKDGQHQPAVRGGGVGPSISKRSEASVTLGHSIEDIE
jgi:hypothetical protein